MLPLILVTNRFDAALKLKLPQVPGARFEYVADLFADTSGLSSAEGLIVRSSTRVDQSLLKLTPKLKFVVTATSGFDHLDLTALGDNGIRSFHIPETQSVAAAELTLYLLLATERKVTLAQKQLRKGAWERSLLLGRQVSGLQLGIVGLGRVGREVAVRANALGMSVCAFDPYLTEPVPGFVTPMGFEELMRSSDVVSLHVPRTKKTRHMIKKETLQWMNTESTLINMSRGDVVNEDDLIDQLRMHPNFRAGLDVFAKEPLSLTSDLLELDNVVLTPHVGASTIDALKASSARSVSMVQDLIEGRPVSGELPPNEAWFRD